MDTPSLLAVGLRLYSPTFVHRRLFSKTGRILFDTDQRAKFSPQADPRSTVSTANQDTVEIYPENLGKLFSSES